MVEEDLNNRLTVFELDRWKSPPFPVAELELKVDDCISSVTPAIGDGV